jgi:glutamine synthetase
MGLSETAYQFIGGVLNAAGEICALTNPVVNSYKRINAPVTLSGATWSPNTISFAGNNRTHMIRVPEPGRFELRLADGAANPYLLPAAVLAAGLDGIARRHDPGAPLDFNMYTEPHKAPPGTKKLPLNLLDAIRAMDTSALLRGALGEEFVTAYVKLKTLEWNEYASHLTEWERARTLDC